MLAADTKADEEKQKNSHALTIINANNAKEIELERLKVFQKQAETIDRLSSDSSVSKLL